MKYHLKTNSPQEFYERMRYLRSQLENEVAQSALYAIANYGTKEVKEFCMNTKIIGIVKTAHIALSSKEKQDAFIRWFWQFAYTDENTGRTRVRKNKNMIDAYCMAHEIY